MECLKGLGTALITPFKEDLSVDYESLARLLDTQLAGGVDYIVVLGTTGEAATLSAEERKEVRQYIVRYVQGRLPLVLGIGGNNTTAVCTELNAIQTAIAEASPIPVILYNVPGRTGVNLLPETVMRIYEAHRDKIAGIKEASGNIAQIKDLIALANSKLKIKNYELPFLVISGDDGIACEIMEAGGAGLISVASNAFAEDFHQIVHRKDARLQAKYAEMIRLLFKEGNPSGIKTVLAKKGIIKNVLRLPLVSNSAEVQEEIKNALSQLA